MSGRLVVDASVAIHVARRTQRAPALVTRLTEAGIVVAPALFAAEVANGFWKYVQSGHLEVSEAVTSYETAIALVDRFVPDEELAVEALTTATRLRHSVYDCLYLVLTRRLGAELVTEDARLARLAAP